MTHVTRITFAIVLGACGGEPVEPTDADDPEQAMCTNGWTLGPDGECVCLGARGADEWCRPITPDDMDADGYTVDVDCNDRDPYVNPGRPENICNGYDDNCDGLGEERCLDSDLDGHPERYDCDDSDPAINPRASEIACNMVDEDCDGRDTCWVDGDGDGDPMFLDGRMGGDCDDADPLVHHLAPDLPCDAIDQNCNGVDCCTQDEDMDGYECRVDCNDESQLFYPGASPPPGCMTAAEDWDCSGTIEEDEICPFTD